MRVSSDGQVTIPAEIRKALGIVPGSEIAFELDRDGGARLKLDRDWVARGIERMRGAGDSDLTTDEILALTRG